MDRLALLKFCRDELAERQKRDEWQGWYWAIRRKVIDYWIAVLERDPESSAGRVSAPELTADERQMICRTHPLLAARPLQSAAVLQPDREWRAALHHRVEIYIAALKAHH
jgi:hypothetical protein